MLLNRNVSLKLFLTKNILEMIIHEDKKHQLIINIKVNYWIIETFYNRYNIMKELYHKFQDDGINIVVNILYPRIL